LARAFRVRFWLRLFIALRMGLFQLTPQCGEQLIAAVFDLAD
jgi:hypothetical protein